MPSLRFYVIIPDRGRMRYVSDRTHLADVVSGSKVGGWSIPAD